MARLRFSRCSFSPFTQRGFTLVELFIVIAILATLAGIAVPLYNSHLETVRRNKVLSELHLLEKEIYAFDTVNDRFPNSLAEMGVGNMMDPWGNPYQYFNIESAGNPGKGKCRKDRNMNPVNTDFDLYSMGADGQSQLPFTPKVSHDDIVRASNGAYFGYAADF